MSSSPLEELTGPQNSFVGYKGTLRCGQREGKEKKGGEKNTKKDTEENTPK